MTTPKYKDSRRLVGISTDTLPTVGEPFVVHTPTDTGVRKWSNSTGYFSLPLAIDTTKVSTDTGYTNSTSGHNVSLTVGANSNRLLLLFLFGGGASWGTITATYGGVNFTALSTNVTSGSPYYSEHRVYALVAPATGANTLIVTQSGSQNIRLAIISLYNAQQSVPTNFATSSGHFANTTIAITPTVTGSWLIKSLAGGSSTNANGFIELGSSDPMLAYKTDPVINSSNTCTFTFSSQPFAAVAFAVAPKT